jgi:hypothetical protein
MPWAISVSTSVSPAGQDVQRGGGRGRDGGQLSAEVGDQPPGCRWGEQRVARGHDFDRVDEFGGGGILEQEPAGAGPQRLVHVFVEVEGGQRRVRAMAWSSATRQRMVAPLLVMLIR